MALGVVPTALLVAISSVVAYYAAKFLRVFLLISRFDGPLALPIIGTTYLSKADKREFFVSNQEQCNHYRQSSRGVFRAWLGPFPALHIYRAEHLEVVLSSSRLLKKGFIYRFVEPWLRTGLLTSNGQKWFHRRKLLTPTFHFSILQNFMDVFNEQSAILSQKLERFADSPEPVNIFPHVAYCVLDIICDTAMGKHINAQGNSENEYVKAVTRMSELILHRSKWPWLWPDLIFYNLPAGKRFLKTLKILHDVTKKMIQERLREPPRGIADGKVVDGGVAGQRRRIAFLDLLLGIHREDESFTLDDIQEEVDTFMFEGHDTTAAGTSWAIFLIGLHPDVQAKIHDELDQIFCDSDRAVTSEDLSKMSYLTRVVKETLRIIPPVPLISRQLEEDITLDGKTVPKGTTAMLSLYALHHDPEVFPDPHRFDPDRFLPENSAGRHPFAYAPFSAGPRNCIGQKFAMMEEKVILANLFRQFSVESVQRSIDEARPAGQLVLRPVDGEIPVKLSRRRPAGLSREDLLNSET